MYARTRVLVSFLLVAVAACSGDVGPVPATEGMRAAILDGQPDSTRSAVFAVRRSQRAADATARAVCTGVLVAPDVVLTARHCVARAPSDLVICGHSSLHELLPPDGVSVSNDAVLTGDPTWYGARAIVAPEEGDDACGFDLAMIVLAEPVASEVAVPMEVRLTQPVMPGEPVTAVGYGEAGDGAVPTARLARSDLTVTCVGIDCGYGVSHSEFMTSDGACRGDSGGPALDEFDRVIGVLSRGGEPCATPIWTSVDAFRGFIMDALEGTAAETWDQSAPSSAGCALKGAAPNDSCVAPALIALLTASLVLTRRRRAATHRSRRSRSV